MTFEVHDVLLPDFETYGVVRVVILDIELLVSSLMHLDDLQTKSHNVKHGQNGQPPPLVKLKTIPL